MEALAGREAKAYLFGSYARGDAHSRSDVDILVITEEMPKDLLGEIAELSSAIHKALGDDVHKGIDLLVVDEKTFNEHKAKNWDGSVYHDVHREGCGLSRPSSKPRTPSSGRQQRSRLAKRAATARWARLGRAS